MTTRALALLSFVLAVACFAALWAELHVTHLLDAGLFFTALGLALDHVPAVTRRAA